jgi:predicted ABC-type ATPase
VTFDSPTAIVIGGPNGAGKSTIAPALLAHLGIETFVNADTIARGLSALNPERRAFEAGRIMLRELHRLADDRESLAFETTLASRTFAPWLKRLASNGYRIVLGYVWVRSPDISVDRVAARVESGGHHVPEADVRRRWSRSVYNFWNLYLPLADEWRAYDNSVSGTTELMAEGGRNQPDVVFNQSVWDLLKKLR